MTLGLAAVPASKVNAHGGGGGGGHGGGGGGGGHMGGGGGMHAGGYGGHMGGYSHPGYGYGGYGRGQGYGYGGYGYGGYGAGLFGLGGYGYGGLGYGSYGGYGGGYGGYGNSYGYGNTYGQYPAYTNPGYGYPGTVNMAAPVTYSSAYQPAGAANLAPAAPGFPVEILGINEDVASDALGSGVKITQVNPGSPAERAGLKVGDMITQSNGYAVSTAGNLRWVISHAANGTLSLSVHSPNETADRVVSVPLQ